MDEEYQFRKIQDRLFNLMIIWQKQYSFHEAIISHAIQQKKKRMIIEHSRDCCYQQISLLAILDCETTLQRIPVLNIGLLDTLEE